MDIISYLKNRTSVIVSSGAYSRYDGGASCTPSTTHSKVIPLGEFSASYCPRYEREDVYKDDPEIIDVKTPEQAWKVPIKKDMFYYTSEHGYIHVKLTSFNKKVNVVIGADPIAYSLGEVAEITKKTQWLSEDTLRLYLAGYTKADIEFWTQEYDNRD